eukprot:TRINITY_DN29893_c0_g1_i2.p1 TRINITY_DN29893_c0_g1~~TRINITY_DN29893_c0_g1_i2.p1  ORF type:complete len:241 (+),score=55.93 TRINITY_DN29893_c0_g1_i2:111-833(+)
MSSIETMEPHSVWIDRASRGDHQSKFSSAAPELTLMSDESSCEDDALAPRYYANESEDTETSFTVASQALGLPTLFKPVDMMEAEVKAKDPYLEQVTETSNMTILHEHGLCKPCFFMSKAKVCNKGDACQFCHLDHGTFRRARPRKTRRQTCQKEAEDLEAFCILTPEAFTNHVLLMASLKEFEPYTMRCMKGKLKNMLTADMYDKDALHDTLEKLSALERANGKAKESSARAGLCVPVA